MNDPTIFVCKPKAISSQDKGKLTKLGVVVIEMDEPKDFKFIKAGIEISSHGLFMAAFKALNSQPGLYSNNTRTHAALQRDNFMLLFQELLLQDNK